MGENNTFPGNEPYNYIYGNYSGIISSNMTIKKMPIPWYIRDTLTVNSGVLTVEPGTEIVFGPGGGICVNSGGTIKMEGTPASRITLRGESDSKGFWGQVRIESTKPNILAYIDLLYGGGGGTARYNTALYLNNGSASVTNCIIDGSGNIGITTEGAQGVLTAFSNNIIKNCDNAPIRAEDAIYSLRNMGANNTFTDNEPNYIYINTSTAPSGDMILKKLNIPWYLSTGLEITTSGKTFTIEPGTEIWVGGGYEINVGANSKLVAIGTVSQRIKFRGDTDAPGQWIGIKVNTQTTGTKFAYCDISGGGPGTSWYNSSCLYILDYAVVQLKEIEISKSRYFGICFYSAHYSFWSSNVTISGMGQNDVWDNDTLTDTGSLPANKWTFGDPTW